MLSRLRTRLAEIECDVFISDNSISRRYLTHFTGTAGLVFVNSRHNILVTDFRYTQQANEQSSDWEIIEAQDTILDSLEHLFEVHKIKKVAFEGEFITVNRLNEWHLRFPDIEFIPTKDLVLEMRMIKSEYELKQIAKACKIADQAFTQIVSGIRPGMKEIEIALELEYAMRKLGADGNSFDPIVGSGPRGAMPHAMPGDRRLSVGDFVVMDFGCMYQGYCSDMTRTILIGEPTAKHREIYDLVLRAQIAGLNAVKAGVVGKDVDAVARDIITAAGYGDHFGHSLGHGVGLEIHEEPRLSKGGMHTLAPGMVVSVEPGVYLPGWGGVRIEDLVVVTKNGCEILSSTNKELIVI